MPLNTDVLDAAFSTFYATGHLPDGERLATAVADRVERSLPRPAICPPNSRDIALPKLLSAAYCTAAIDKIISAITAGTVDLATAKFLLDAVERRRKAIETVEHEEKITALEQAVETVDLTRNSRGR